MAALRTTPPRRAPRRRELDYRETVSVAVVYHQQRFGWLRLAEFAQILLDLEETARRKLLEKMLQRKREVYPVRQNTRAP